MLGPGTVVVADSSYMRPDGARVLTAGQASPVTAMASSSSTAVQETSPGLGPRPAALIVPDLAVVVPAGVSAAQLSAIRELRGVRAVLAVDGAQIDVNGHTAGVLGVPAVAFRAWTPPVTAAATGLWPVLAAGSLVAASGTAAGLGLSLGGSYSVNGTMLPVTATAPLRHPGRGRDRFKLSLRSARPGPQCRRAGQRAWR